MGKYNLDEGSLLSEIRRYNLSRSSELGGQLYIDIHKVIAGANVGEYVAIPNLIIGETNAKYIAHGSSEEEVLKKCLDLIKGVHAKDILPSISFGPQASD